MLADLIKRLADWKQFLDLGPNAEVQITLDRFIIGPKVTRANNPWPEKKGLCCYNIEYVMRANWSADTKAWYFVVEVPIFGEKKMKQFYTDHKEGHIEVKASKVLCCPCKPAKK